MKDLDQQNKNEDDNIIRMPTPKEQAAHAKEQERAQRKQNQSPREPLINLPPVTKIMIALFVLIHLGMEFLITPPLRYDIYMTWGFIPARYSGAMPFDIAAITGLIGYSFLHGSWAHVLINTIMMAAFGAGVERFIGGKRMILLFALCSLTAAFTQFALTPQSTEPVIGASGGISGLFAAAILMLHQRGNLGVRSLWPLVIIWIVISALFGMVEAPGGGTIAWAAHIGGFLAGLALFKPIVKFRS